MRVAFVDKVKKQLELQGQGSSPHPDPIIRIFYQALSPLLEKKNRNQYRQIINQLHHQRRELDETCVVNLWFRALQWIFCQRGQSDYRQWDISGWHSYLVGQGLADLPDLLTILLSQNTATHVIERYRSLATLIRLKKTVKILDVGCSLGLGLKASLAEGILEKNSFIDETPDQQISCNLKKPIDTVRAIGIDSKIPTLEWVKACNYPSRYLDDGQKLEEALLSLSGIEITLKEISLLNTALIKSLEAESEPFDLVHSALTTYELSASDRKLGLRNIAALLKEGGIYLEFTFKNPKSWFEGIHTLVRIKKNGKLSRPFVWHEWTDSRCTRVKAGQDWQKVNRLLGI